MKIWRFSDPSKAEYARASRRGSWAGSPSRRVRPLVIEWEPGSDVVGDFTWPGFDSELVVKASVANALQEAEVPGFEFCAIEMLENSEPAKRRSKERRVELPYSGSNLGELHVTTWTRLDRERSTVTEVKNEDGTTHFVPRGVQHMEQTWDRDRAELITRLHPRVAGEGLVVRETNGIFRIQELPAWVFCTDDVKRVIDEHGFTNVRFLEMGDTLDESAIRTTRTGGG